MTRREYPHAERLDLVEEIHGRAVADPYRWLEDPEDPRTAAWLEAQSALFSAERETWPARRRFEERLTALMATGSVTSPVWRGGRAFFTRRTAEQEHPVLLVAEPGGTERVLLDPVELDPYGLTVLDEWKPSNDGALLAYLVSVGGVEESYLSIIDVASGRRVDGPIDRLRFSTLAWLPGGEALYYERRLAPDLVPPNESQYHERVWLHRVGADPATDVMVYGEGTPLNQFAEPAVSADGRWLQVYPRIGTDPRNDVFVADLSASPPEAPVFAPVQVGVDAQTSLQFARPDSPLPDRVYIRTDRDAPRGRICFTTTGDFGYESWRDLVAEDPDTVLADFAILDGPRLERPLLLVLRTRHAVGEIGVHDLETGEQLGEVPLPGIGTVAELTVRGEGGHEAWFTYTDFGTPVRVLRYDAATGETAPWGTAPGGAEIPSVRARQLTYRSKDGTEVRMFVLDDGADDGPRPTVMHGYGGFGISLAPEFNATSLAWVALGGRFVVPSLRGGGEEGEAWHRAGMFAGRQNVYDDFHAAADFLVAEGLTTTPQFGIWGGSNGGLLVGVALTQHPEKYAAVVCSAPVLDMVRYERVGMGEYWSGEFGTAANPEHLGWLLGYSPYHNVYSHNVRGGHGGDAGGADVGAPDNTTRHPAVQYPATLFAVFGGDTRVDPMHARKMAAALQYADGGEGPILLRLETGVGHGARSVSRRVGVAADEFAFLAARLGLAAPQ